VDIREGVEEEFKMMFDEIRAAEMFNPEERDEYWVPWASYPNCYSDDDDNEDARIGSKTMNDAENVINDLKQEYNTILNEKRARLERIAADSSREAQFYYDFIEDDVNVGTYQAREMIVYNPLLKAMRAWGPNKCALIRHLRIQWGEYETNWDCDLHETGPHAMGIMGLLCKFWLPGVTQIRLRKLVRVIEGRLESHCFCEADEKSMEGRFNYISNKRKIVRVGINSSVSTSRKDERYSLENSEFVQGFDMLVESCTKVCYFLSKLHELILYSCKMCNLRIVLTCAIVLRHQATGTMAFYNIQVQSR
jgi:hypothetical protein